MTRTFVDAGVLIAGTRLFDPLGHRALAVLDDPDRVFVSSVFVHLEVLPKAIYHRNLGEAALYQRFFDRVVAWAEPLDRLVANARREAAQHGLNALDALHVAAAVMLGADELVTTEAPRKPIHRVTSVKVVAL